MEDPSPRAPLHLRLALGRAHAVHARLPLDAQIHDGARDVEFFYQSRETRSTPSVAAG